MGFKNKIMDTRMDVDLQERQLLGFLYLKLKFGLHSYKWPWSSSEILKKQVAWKVEQISLH